MTSIRVLLLSSMIVSMLIGCTVGPDYVKPEIESPNAWAGRLEGGLTSSDLDPAVLSEWWKTFNDPLLNQLIDKAITANLDLRTAQSQLRQARAQRAITGANQSPVVNLGASANVSDSTATGGATDLYSAGFDAGWEIDVFGGQRREREAAEADLRVAQENRRDVLISIIAEVAVNYAELRTYQAQLAVAEKNLDIQQQSLDIVQAKFDQGAVTELDLNQAITNVANTRATIPSLNQNIVRSKNRLAVLLGQQPGALNSQLDAAQSLPAPSLEIAVGVPAETLRRRPDVRRAERQLAAETARVGVAVAELYPKFTLSGTIGLESSAQTIGLAGIGLGLNWNIFDRSRIRNQIEVQSAVQEQALIAYEASILTALEDVENALTAFAEEQRRYVSLTQSAQAAARSAEVARTRYEAGASDFLSVLDGERVLLTSEDNQAVSEGLILSNLIKLYKSLGGGWAPELPDVTD